MLPLLSTLNLLDPPTCKSKSNEPDALFVPLDPAAFTTKALNVCPESAHVWLIVTGALVESEGEVSHEFRDTFLLIEFAESQTKV